MRRLMVIIVILVVSTAACQKNSAGNVDTYQGSGPTKIQPSKPYTLDLEKGPANLGQLKMNLNQLDAFHGRFVLEFEGQSQWSYRVETRSDGTNMEYQLNVEGLEGGQYLGDVRLVNSMGINLMNGPGTGNECVQFPDSFITEPLFLDPTNFIHLKEFSTPPEETGSDLLLNREAVRYATADTYHLGWRDVSVTFWLDPQTGAVLRYEFQAQGKDPLYLQGDGSLHGVFEVLEIGPQQIESFQDCVIEFPIPDDAAEIIRFPGLISFTTSFGPNRLDSYYTPVFEDAGWVREEPIIIDQTQAGRLEFNSQNRSAIINIAALNPDDLSQGYVIEIFLDE
jgi:hypothetical protein